MPGRASTIAVLAALLCSGCAGTATASPSASPGEPTPSHGGVTIYVDVARGNDHGPGTNARPLRTVTAAWNRIPQSRTLKRPYTIVLEPGRWGATETPNYWQLRWGTQRAEVTLRAASPGTATLPAVNMFDVRWLLIDDVRFSDQFDLFHCEQCAHMLIEHSSFDGSQQLLDTVKFNQSTWVFLRHDRITGASQNPLQFVAVQHGAVTDNELADGGDWCAYFKGGSADLLIARNRVHDCATGGLLAGQGTGLQFMVPPYFRYEAYRIVIAQNWVWRTQGAGIGVNGGLQAALVDNRLWATGSASHPVEIDYGLRSCDGHPGDAGRQLCGRYLAQGAWGTTRVDNGSNEVRIPNLDVTVAGNVIANPRVQGDELLDIAAPFSGPDQAGSGLGAVRADEGLRVFDNLFAVGRGLPNGTDNCQVSDCRRLRRVNTVTAPSDPFVNPAIGDLALRRGWRGVPVPGYWRG
jgi:hypothetical protein